MQIIRILVPFILVFLIFLTASVSSAEGAAPSTRSEGEDTPCEVRFTPYDGPRKDLFLSEGDRIAVIAPASVPRPGQVDATVSGLAAWGYVPVEGKHVREEIRTLENCIEDLEWALADPSVKAVFCVRGGYGASDVMDRIPAERIRSASKLIIGYSDISACHAAWTAAGLPSLHCSMSSAFTDLPEANAEAEKHILRGEIPAYTCQGSPYDRAGEAEGVLIGGNLSTLIATLNTAYDCTAMGIPYILFLEDVDEDLQHIHRCLTVLKHFGVLDRASGILCGEWIDRPLGAGDDHDGSSRGGLYSCAAEMIAREFTGSLDIPSAFGFPAGHGTVNWPLLMGAKARLVVTEDRFSVEWP